MYPSSTLESRTALRDTVLPVGGGIDGNSPIHVGKGTEVKINILALHRSESVFGPNPNSFWPDRWDFIQPAIWEYIPFGRGPRSCLRKQKGVTETQYALARLIREFKEIRALSEDDGGLEATDGKPEQCRVFLVHA